MVSFRAGDADRRITVQFLGTTQDAAGQEVEDWADLCRPWAKVTTPRIGRLSERFQEDQTIAVQMKEFEVRWDARLADLDAKRFRIVFDGRVHDILSFEELGRKVAWRIIAEARAD